MPLAYTGIIIALIIVVLYNTIKILKEYERGVIFFLGRFQTVKGPGLIILIPGLQKMTKTDLRVVVMDVPTQDVISRDNVSVKVNAVIYFRIVDPEKAVIRVANVFEATSQLSQTTLRSVLGQHDLDDMLAERDKLNADIQAILDQRTDNWGIKVSNVEIKHVDLDESMIRAIAQQAEAERSRRAKIINAEGERQAAQMLAEAAHILASEEQGLQLRYLQTLKEIAGEKTNTIVFPMPLEFVEPIINLVNKQES
jgi:regulator of protease activity HflC (stomatin/prohibitin superfamily)